MTEKLLTGTLSLNTTNQPKPSVNFLQRFISACLKSDSPGINLWTSVAPQIQGWSCCWFLIFISSQCWFFLCRFSMTGIVHWWVRPSNVIDHSRTLSNGCTCVKLVKVTPVCYYWPFQGGVSVDLISLSLVSLSLFLFVHYFVLAI